MKKLKILVPFLIAVSVLMSGCNKTDSNNNSAGTAENSSVADNLESTGDSAEYDKLVESFKPLVDSYYNSIMNKDYDEFSSVFPKFYLKALENESGIGKDGYTGKDFMQNNYDWYVNQYGSDFDYAYEFGDIARIMPDSIEECKASIKQYLDADVDIEEAYAVNVQEKVTGSKLETPVYNEIPWLILKIGGKYWLYETYYEK